MTNLFIDKLQYNIITEDNAKYGATIPFKHGLNIIYGPNSVGKTSIITGVIYGLGLEKSLGIFQNKQNPFKPEFYEKIENKTIKKSYLLLQISNLSKTYTIARSLINKTDIVVVKECLMEEFNQTINEQILIASGEGVTSERGLEYFLFKFLNWEIVNVPKYDGGTSTLYLENIAPLFFVEQTAGWSQIQARQISRYGIREVKKVVFEYLMGLDKFLVHIKELLKKDLQEKINRLRRELKEKEEAIIILANAKQEDDMLFINKPGVSTFTINDLINYLEELYKEREKTLNSLTQIEEKSNLIESSKKEELRRTTHLKRRAGDKINSLTQEISSYENYINRININKIKNKQLKKINSINLDFNISICPICESNLQSSLTGACKLCKTEVKRLSTPDENLEFLEDEKSSFEKVAEQKRLELKKARKQFEDLKDQEEGLIKLLDHEIKTYFGAEINTLRDKVSELDSIFREIELYKRLKKRWDGLKDLRKSIKELEKQELILNNEIKKYEESEQDEIIKGSILDYIKDNLKILRLFKNKEYLLAQIKMDETDHYIPYLESYDLYNITSSSDNVRIILSYYLSLLQTSLKHHSLQKIKFPNLLILDEPKQQNLDDKDFMAFIKIIESINSGNYQIIITTYNQHEKDRSLFQKYISYEMKSESDYLLKRIDNVNS